LVWSRAFTGFATGILLELIIGSLLMISLGIIGEYLARIYEEVKGRPRYIVSESIERER
jgi:polyisoprenyl-phosphate glycosyltransferase